MTPEIIMNHAPVIRRRRLARLIAPAAGLFLLGAGLGAAQAHGFDARDHSTVNLHRHLPIRHGHGHDRHHYRHDRHDGRSDGYHRYRHDRYEARRGWRDHRHAYDRHYYRGYRDHRYARHGWRDQDRSFFGRW